MRRKEKQITERKEMDDIINASPVCRMAMAHGNEPYLVPLAFGYDGNAVYIHTAIQGKKIEIIEANPRVCIEFEHKVQVMKNDNQACKWSFSFQSVIGFGTISELRDPHQKIRFSQKFSTCILTVSQLRIRTAASSPCKLSTSASITVPQWM
jgi:nitroimidazol reductase NimA-like FMN-containing flavoprotein (pyridoxamine 5'-phosphate oxidase superfamily)